MRPQSRTKEQIGEVLILEQYLRVLHPDIRIWVKEHNPQTGEGAADLAEHYTAAHRDSAKKRMTVGKPRFEESKPCSFPVMDSVYTGAGKKPAHSNLKPNYLVCFYCHYPDHKASVCPLKKIKMC